MQANVSPLAEQQRRQGAAAPLTASAPLSALRAAAAALLPALRVPTLRSEEYRFTDLAPLTSAGLVAAAADAPSDPAVASLARALTREAKGAAVVTVDGAYCAALSDASALCSAGGGGVYVGPVAGAPAEAAAQLGRLSAARGGPFAAVNGALATDAVVLHVPAGAAPLSGPLFVLHLTTGRAAAAASAAGGGGGGGGARAASAPRVLVVLGAGAEAALVEEHASASPSGSFEAAVVEVVLGEGARLEHSYAARPGSGDPSADDSAAAAARSPAADPSAAAAAPSTALPLPPVHLRATLVEQAAGSSYSLVEARAGGAAGALTRHDVDVTQLGGDTATAMSHFVLCGPGQLHDLHTRLQLDHPRAKARQLHKCIASSATSRGVFDGAVRVGRLAQQTDAGQLTRSLLLAPRATVHARPNLQIVADDVRCTHGCAISDLSDEEMFYFRARGVPAASARGALVASFGSEVVRALGSAALAARVRADTVAALRAADALPPAAAVGAGVVGA